MRHPLQLIREFLRDFRRSQELIWILFVRDLKAQYRQSLLGYVWLIAPPIGTATVWFFLRSQRVIRVETDVPYILFVMIGITIWMSFIAILRAPLTGFLAGKAVFTKLNVPAEAFVLSKLLRAFFDTGIRLLTLVPVFFLVKFVPPSTFYLFPVALFLFFSIAVGIGLLCVPIGSLYGDIGNALANFLRVFMYLSPVIYPIGKKTGLLNDIMVRNPLTPGIALSRDVITSGSLEWMNEALVVSSVSVVIAILALFLIRIAKPHLVARMGM